MADFNGAQGMPTRAIDTPCFGESVMYCTLTYPSQPAPGGGLGK